MTKTPPTRSARERLRAERHQAAQRTRRRRERATVLAVCAGLLGLIGLFIAIQTNRARDDRPLVAPAGATGEDHLVIPVGRPDAPVVLTMYEDPRCPGCAQIERELHTTINKLEDEGKLRVEYHVLSFVDRIARGNGSKKAANALAAAQDAGRFREFHDVLFAHPPASEETDTFGDTQVLLDLAEKVPALPTAEFTKAVTQGTHDTWVSAVQHRFDQQTKITGTPALFFKGRDLLRDPDHPLTPQRLTELVTDEARTR
ncbi:thioredoxin domain-containing protein [Streptomyces sp. NPDC090442]|uniref:DsbA family protein n=1 Tax=Streptomyces sp. NPDC090442 TaxID=3365962 RepID=UPI003821C75B